jgi:hypothetical protein
VQEDFCFLLDSSSWSFLLWSVPHCFQC